MLFSRMSHILSYFCVSVYYMWEIVKGHLYSSRLSIRCYTWQWTFEDRLGDISCKFAGLVLSRQSILNVFLFDEHYPMFAEGFPDEKATFSQWSRIHETHCREVKRLTKTQWSADLAIIKKFMMQCRKKEERIKKDMSSTYITTRI